MDSNKLDEIPARPAPALPSINATRLNNVLDKKCKQNGNKWINISRRHLCISDIYKNNLCQIHYNEQLNINILGEIIIKNNKTYIWTLNGNSKEWKPLCSVELCRKQIFKNGFCQNHYKNPTTSSQSTLNIFNTLR